MNFINLGLILEQVSLDSEYTCGTMTLAFSGTFPYIVSIVITLIKIVVPILLIIFGMLDLAKSVIASKEDEIKKGQQILIKRVIAALIVFFVVQVVQIVVRFVSSNDSNSTISDCLNCFIHADTDDGCEIVPGA